MAEGKVPVRESVGAALRSVRENIGLIFVVALVGGAAAAALGIASALTQSNPGIAMIVSLANTFVVSYIYAALTGAALFGSGAVAGRLMADGGRLWVAMAILTFFFIIVFIVLLIPGFVVFFMAMAPYAAELQSAGQDQAAVMAVLARAVQANPAPLLLLGLFYIAVWFYLSSRLYLSAPATISAQRILTFETWKWTKGNTLRIIGARLLLLIPANIIANAVTLIVGRLVGIDIFDPTTAAAVSQSNLFGFAAYMFVSTFAAVLLFQSLEAALSAYLYRGLRPEAKAADTF